MELPKATNGMKVTPNLDQLDNVAMTSTMQEPVLLRRTVAYGLTDVCLMLKTLVGEVSKMNRTLALMMEEDFTPDE